MHAFHIVYLLQTTLTSFNTCKAIIIFLFCFQGTFSHFRISDFISFAEEAAATKDVRKQSAEQWWRHTKYAISIVSCLFDVNLCQCSSFHLQSHSIYAILVPIEMHTENVQKRHTHKTRINNQTEINWNCLSAFCVFGVGQSARDDAKG